MARYVIMERGDALGEAEAVAGARIVRDGFSFVAFLVAPLWLLWHGLWLEAVLAFLAALVLGIAGEASGLPVVSSILSLLLAVYFGLEGAALRLSALRRRGWQEWGAIEADSLADAEIRYAALVVGGEGSTEEPSPPTSYPWAQALSRRPTGPALGLLNYPGN